MQRRWYQTWRGTRGRATIVTASALNKPSNAQPRQFRFARDIRGRWRVPFRLHPIEIRVTPQRMLHEVLNRMKCEDEQRAGDYSEAMYAIFT